MKTEHVTDHELLRLTRIALRRVREYATAAQKHNFDCNTRDAEPGDAKRNALFWARTNAYNEMMLALDAITGKAKP